MLLRRFYHDGLAQASYLLGCQKTGEALVVDPHRDADEYVAAAAAEGVRITHVTETHIHADYLSGSRELCAATGARLLLSGEGGRDWQYAFADADGATLLHDGDTFMIGNLRLQAVHTPGHTPEHVCFVVTDTPASDRPVGAFTGDFLFVGDVGRPDLLERAAQVAGTMREGARQLFASLQRFGATYPDYLQVWPGHGSGSACGKALGAVPQTTLGYEKVANWALQLRDEAAFVEAVLEGQPSPPRYFATMKRMNRAGPPVLGPRPPLPRCDLAEVDAAVARGSVVVDLRAAAVAMADALPFALNIPYGKSFVGWAGWLLDYDRDLYLLAAGDDAAAAEAARRELAMIGLDRVRGRLGDAVLAEWRGAGRATDRIAQVTPDALAGWIARGAATVVDVREPTEWAAGHIPGAHHVPLGRLAEALPSLPRGRTLVLHCQAGARSAIACSVAHRAGVTGVANLAGGFAAWRGAGAPVAVPEPRTA